MGDYLRVFEHLSECEGQAISGEMAEKFSPREQGLAVT
jgi:hypothetical protein